MNWCDADDAKGAMDYVDVIFLSIPLPARVDLPRLRC
jgi:hypothetical protein